MVVILWIISISLMIAFYMLVSIIVYCLDGSGI